MSGGAMWGGRFQGSPEEVFRALNDSLPVDWRLVQHDIRGSVAWAGALGAAGVYTSAESQRVVTALRSIAAEAETLAGPPVESGAEDVHTWVEQRLIESVGPLGKKLHTGRSRNDQVATDLRLWLREAIDRLEARLLEAADALLDQADAHAGTPFPAYTHMQSAQPITFGHWCLAYAELVGRDRGRLRDARARMDECPLGSAALAGTTYPVDRERIARELGFAGPTRNSLDAVSSRDHAIEVLSALAVLGTNLSRLAEDLIIYNSTEFGLVVLDDGVTSGSSLMPQKKNPDSLELIRGAAGPLAGALVSLLTTVKGLPMSYNKDLQLDKEALFHAVDRAGATIRLTARTVSGLTINERRARELAEAGHANATDLADLLVRAGVPFRDAHDRVGRAVKAAIELGVAINDLPARVAAELLPELDASAARSLTTRSLLEARDVLGGTAPSRVRAAAEAARRRLHAR